MGDVIELGVITTGDIPPEKVLRAAIEANLKNVIVLGETIDGEDIHFAISTGDAPLVNWLLDAAKYKIIQDSVGDE